MSACSCTRLPSGHEQKLDVQDEYDQDGLGEEDESATKRCNAAWVSGPVGCGKSAAIAAVAQVLAKPAAASKGA